MSKDEAPYHVIVCPYANVCDTCKDCLKCQYLNLVNIVTIKELRKAVRLQGEN